MACGKMLLPMFVNVRRRFSPSWMTLSSTVDRFSSDVARSRTCPSVTFAAPPVDLMTASVWFCVRSRSARLLTPSATAPARATTPTSAIFLMLWAALLMPLPIPSPTLNAVDSIDFRPRFALTTPASNLRVSRSRLDMSFAVSAMATTSPFEASTPWHPRPRCSDASPSRSASQRSAVIASGRCRHRLDDVRPGSGNRGWLRPLPARGRLTIRR